MYMNLNNLFIYEFIYTMNSYDFFIYEFICIMNSCMNSGVPRFQMKCCRPSSLSWFSRTRRLNFRDVVYMNIEKKAPTNSGTASLAPTFRLDAGLRHNFKQGLPVHFEIWAVGQTAGSDTADKGHPEKRL